MKKDKFPLFLQILIALILGVLFGVFMPDYVGYVSWLGEIFINGLKMIIIPLIVSSIISAIVGIKGIGNLGRIGIRTFIYYIFTSTIAILTGLFFVNLIKPGIGADLGFVQSVDNIQMVDNPLKDTIINIVPSNIFIAFYDADMLSIIFFTILFGIFITKVGDKHRQIMSDFFNALYEVIMKLTQFIIKFTPLGVFGIISAVIAKQNDLAELASRLSIYMLVVLAGLFFHAFVSLALLLRTVAKVNPFKHFKLMLSALLTAFSTSSSGATLSLTMDTVKNKVGVSNKVASFTLPLGATINMDGTALYELVVAMFIAQAYGIELTITQQLIAVTTALLASIGAAGIPMAGLVMISIVLTALNLPLEGLGLILAVDRILDMFRTAVNVWSDSCAAIIIAKLEGEKLNI